MEQRSHYQVGLKNTGECTSPKLKSLEQPEMDGAAAWDHEYEAAELVTGPLFGCVNFEPK
jgi:hypothetical protein